MRFEWDERKNRLNRKKQAYCLRSRRKSLWTRFVLPSRTGRWRKKKKFWTIGRLENLVIVVVVHTTCEETDEEAVRIISARKAVPRERRSYEEADSQAAEE